MRRHLKARYLGPALVALVMIIYGAVTSVRNTRVNLTRVALVDRTRIVIIELQNCLAAMTDMETGHRGYLLTGDEVFLKPYHEADGSLDRHINRLEELTRDRPGQAERIAEIRDTSTRKQEEMERGLEEMRTNGPAAAAAVVATGRGRELMEHFRQLIGQMRQEEADQLEARQKQLVRGFKETNTVVVTTGIIAISAGVIGTLLLALFLMAKERQERLQFEKEKALQADKAKTDFLAMMSHEIRTPMNAILGFGELLHDMVDTPQQKHFAKAIVSSGNSLLSLINDILDLAKVEAHKMELHPETVEMKRFAENLETLFSFRAQEKGIAFGIHLDPAVPAFLTFDTLRMRQVLVNLVGNAVKFTREGSVQVEVRSEAATSSDNVILHFEVTDTGIGISGENVTEIFRPFFQVETQHGRNFQGTGLGLSISERLVDLMGGKISVQSELKKGSIFRVAVPVQRRVELETETIDEPSESQVDFDKLAPSKILVVDDVPLNRELIRGYLQGSHHQVLEAENGEQALAACRRQVPDVILMEVRTPASDGASAQALLKSLGSAKKIPLVAITASVSPENRERIRRIFDGFAGKPLSRERLYLELSKFLPVQAAAATRKPEPETQVVVGSHGREWPALKAELVSLQEKVLPGLIELVPAQATLRFASDLADLAREHDCPPLVEFAAELKAAATNMDFSEAGRILARFPGLTESLADTHV